MKGAVYNKQMWWNEFRKGLTLLYITVYSGFVTVISINAKRINIIYL